jgi:hypothetical protein
MSLELSVTIVFIFFIVVWLKNHNSNQCNDYNN